MRSKASFNIIILRYSIMKHPFIFSLFLTVFVSAMSFAAEDAAVNGKSDKAREILKNLERKKKIKDQERTVLAKEQFQTGKKLYKQFKFREARKYFSRAIENDPEHAEAKKYLNMTDDVLGARLNKIKSRTGHAANVKEVRIREALLEVENAISEADILFQKAIKREPAPDEGEVEYNVNKLKDINKAAESYRKADETITWFPYDVPLDKEKKYVQGKLKEITDERRRINATINQLKKKQAYTEAEKELALSEKRLDLRVDKLMEQAQNSYDREDYRQCERILDTVQELKPTYKRAAKLRKKSMAKRHALEKKKIKEEEEEHWTTSVEKIKEAAIPWAKIIEYSENWDELSKRKIGGDTQRRAPEWKLRLERELERPVTFNFVETQFSEALDVIRDISGVNIILDPNAFQDAAGAGKETPISLKVTDMKLKHALKWLVDQVGLQYTLSDHTVFISTAKLLHTNIETKTYDVKDLLITIQDFPAPEMSLEVNAEGGDGGDIIDWGDGGGDVGGGEDASTLAGLIRDHIQPTSWDPEIGTSIVAVPQGDQIIVNQSPEVHQEIMDFLTRLRRQMSAQVMVEARFIEIQDSFLSDIGINWRGLDQAAVGDGNWGSTPEPAGYLSDVNKLDNYDYRLAVDNGVASTTAPEGLFLQYTMLGREQAEVVMVALENSGKRKTLASPRITVFNNQLAHIAIVQQITYISDYTITNGLYDPDLSVLLEGVILEVRPTISSDRKYVRLQVKPSIRTLDEMQEINIIQGDQTTVNNLTTDLTWDLDQLDLRAQMPRVAIRQLATNVSIPDKGMVILGGLADYNELEFMNGIPILSKIPILGRLFRRNHKEKVLSDMIILVSAQIILFEEIEAEL